MEYKVLSGPFTAGKLERDLNSHAAEGWRVAGTFQAISAITRVIRTASVRGAGGRTSCKRQLTSSPSDQVGHSRLGLPFLAVA